MENDEYLAELKEYIINNDARRFFKIAPLTDNSRIIENGRVPVDIDRVRYIQDLIIEYQPTEIINNYLMALFPIDPSKIDGMVYMLNQEYLLTGETRIMDAIINKVKHTGMERQVIDLMYYLEPNVVNRTLLRHQELWKQTHNIPYLRKLFQSYLSNPSMNADPELIHTFIELLGLGIYGPRDNINTLLGLCSSNDKKDAIQDELQTAPDRNGMILHDELSSSIQAQNIVSEVLSSSTAPDEIKDIISQALGILVAYNSLEVRKHEKQFYRK